jgi:hypothetical protein
MALRSALFVIAIIAAAFLLVGAVISDGGKALAPHRNPRRSNHVIICQPGLSPEC